MRVFLKKDILETIQTIYEAHREIRELIRENDCESVCSMLADCQTAAIQIGTAIEESEGEGVTAVHYLEEYCEAVYETAEHMTGGTDGNSEQELLDHKLKKVENSVNNDIRIKLEIVFIPYKASMWDALESIWKAADEDPDCNARVVPIPYYDKNPDGSFGEMHYEGADFPDYVPIVHYEDYNLELMKPDVVYCHNPYDQFNAVTSIDPRFYSEELKKYTECLVYIPYFVVDETKSIEKLYDLAYCPAVRHSHLVIVQSEKVKDKYVECWVKHTEHLESFQNARQIFENKIIGIGSPKFDVADIVRPPLESLPREWQDIIGSGDKKIILYNTHLSLVLAQYAERFLRKLENVLAYFKKRTDVILLWRPHPLTISTIRAMNTAVYEPYMNIVNRYRSEGWGIYDDTPDMHKAIALSDAYYGADSSVIPIYNHTGKPVMIHNIDVLTEDI